MARAIVSDARGEILDRIRAALSDVPSEEQASDVSVAREYLRGTDEPAAIRIERLAGRLRDYHAEVHTVAAAEISQAVNRCCAVLDLRRVVVPASLPEAWRPADVDVVEDESLAASELDELDAAVTGCAAAIAETGTLVLDGTGTSGRRVITLVPDHHICIVAEDQVVGSVPEAIAGVAQTVTEHGSPITLISGPSASSDIELTRVEGVHGPRHLIVLIVKGA